MGQVWKFNAKNMDLLDGAELRGGHWTVSGANYGWPDVIGDETEGVNPFAFGSDTWAPQVLHFTMETACNI